MTTSVYGVFFNKDGRVLLVKDAHSLNWGFPGGMVEAHEQHGGALKREFFEETGFEIANASANILVQSSPDKLRFFYKIPSVEGNLRVNGNGSDIAEAAFFDVVKLPMAGLSQGIKSIIDMCSS